MDSRPGDDGQHAEEHLHSFGYLLRRLRKARDLSQESLARQVGCAGDTIHKIETDTRRPSLAMAERIATILGLTKSEREGFILLARGHYLAEAPRIPGRLAAVDIIAPAHNRQPLPLPTTQFIGRAAELDQLERLLTMATTRLITIYGLGGVGKTRLALAAAEQQLAAGNFNDGVCFVALAPISSAEQIVPTMAAALGVSPLANGRRRHASLQQLLNYLQKKQLLLILDNCEHMRDGVADLVLELITGAPRVKILATSRERLNLQAEHLVELGGLPVNEQSDALQLFTVTAQRHRLDFALTEATRPEVRQICELVEGLPLAIELAASWVDMLPLSAIAAEIDHDGAVLATAVHDLPERHRSMQAVFDSTWQRLSEVERTIFARLSIFRGGCRHEAIQAITGATLQQLATFGARSLLHYDLRHERYNMHELLRHYAATYLASDPAQEQALREGHATYYLNMLAAQTSRLKGADQQTAFAVIEADSENMRAAWTWATTQRRIDLLAPAMEALSLFCQWRGRYDEGLAACRAVSEALARLQSVEALQTRALALGQQSFFLFLLGHIEAAHHCIDQGLALLDHALLAESDTRAVRAFLLLHRADAIAYQGLQYATADVQASLDLARAVDDPWAIATALRNLALNLRLQGHDRQALPLLSECLTIQQTLGDRVGQSETLSALSLVARYLGLDYDAYDYAAQAIALGRQLANRALIAQGYANLSSAALAIGHFDEAYEAAQAGMTLCSELGDPDGSALLCYNYARLSSALIALGRYDEARDLAEHGLLQARQSGDTVSAAFCLFRLGGLALVEGTDARAFDLLNECVQIADQLGAMVEKSYMNALLALAEQRLGRPAEARRRLAATLHDNLCNPDRPASPLALAQLLACGAIVLAGMNQAEQAFELAARALELPIIYGGLYQRLLEEPVAAAAAQLPAEVAVAARERGVQLTLEAAVHKLLEELARVEPTD